MELNSSDRKFLPAIYTNLQSFVNEHFIDTDSEDGDVILELFKDVN